MSETPTRELANIVPARERRYAMILLLIIGILNALDRQVMNILAEPIKNDLGLLDWQLGLLTGLTFAIFYTVFGLPVARLAERTSRPAVIAASLFIWSIFTAACGFAQSFLQLCLGRMGVAIGESGATPSTHSLISDFYPKEKRASRIAFYSLCAPIGALIGMSLGGVAADTWGWRAAFWLAAAPGVLLAIFSALTFKEPRRYLPKVTETHTQPMPSTSAIITALVAKPTFVLATAGGAIKMFISYGQAPFVASFFFRVHENEVAQLAASVGLEPLGFIGIALGLTIGIAGLIGIWVGGIVSDSLARRDLAYWMTFPAVIALIQPIFLVLAVMQDQVVPALVFFAINFALSSLYAGPVFAAVQSVSPKEGRAVTSAFMLFIMTLFGLGLGPIGVGALSDYFSIGLGMGAADGIRWALALSSLCGFIAFALFWLARKHVSVDVVA